MKIIAILICALIGSSLETSPIYDDLPTQKQEKLSFCPNPWGAIAQNEDHPQHDEASLMCMLIGSVQMEDGSDPYRLKAEDSLRQKQLKRPNYENLRELVTVDNDDDVKLEGKILAEADLQQRFMESGKLRNDIQNFRQFPKKFLSRQTGEGEPTFEYRRRYRKISPDAIIIDPEHWTT